MSQAPRDDGALARFPFCDSAAAEAVAEPLLDEGTIAGANLLPAMHSLYCWSGERGKAQQVGVPFKTATSLLDPAVARMVAVHPYKVPPVLGWHCGSVASATQAWMGGLLR